MNSLDEADSFIKRIRRKSGVYGEFWLWPETVQSLRWAKERRNIIQTESPYLLLTSQGKGYADETKSKKKPSRIRNLWVNLFKTIKAEPERKDFRYLAFSEIRKVAGDMVRDQSNGEVAGVFLCHGKPVKTDQLSDLYTNRPFGKVFEIGRAHV